MEDLPGSWDLLVSSLTMCDLKGVARETVDRQRYLQPCRTRSRPGRDSLARGLWFANDRAGNGGANSRMDWCSIVLTIALSK